MQVKMEVASERMMLLLFLMMPKLELTSAVPRLPVFWSHGVARPVVRAVYLRMSLTESCLLEISNTQVLWSLYHSAPP